MKLLLRFSFLVFVDPAEIIHVRGLEDGKSEYYVHYHGCKYSSSVFSFAFRVVMKFLNLGKIGIDGIILRRKRFTFESMGFLSNQAPQFDVAFYCLSSAEVLLTLKYKNFCSALFFKEYSETCLTYP